MIHVFTIDHWRFGRVLAYAVIIHAILLVGSKFLPHFLSVAIQQKQVNPLPPKVAINIIQPDYGSFTESSHSTVAAISPRRRTISATSHAKQDVGYLEKWQTYVEKYGNDHYPAVIANNHLSGNLRLLVAINRDGSLGEVTVRRSSGSPILDQAAINIVKEAAPFEPLPPEIADNTDVLEIIRTWQFRGKLSTVS